MIKLSKTERIKEHQTFKKHARNITKLDATEKIKAANKSTSDMANPTPAQQFSSELFYSSLRNLTDAYKHFYHDEHELEENLKHLTGNHKELIKEMKELINSFNNTMVSLHEFDKAFETYYVDTIKNILLRYQYYLKSSGITVLSDCQLKLDLNVFLKAINMDKKILRFLLNSKNGLFIRFCNIFHGIKIPRKSDDIKNFSPIDVTGAIIDWRG